MGLSAQLRLRSGDEACQFEDRSAIQRAFAWTLGSPLEWAAVTWQPTTCVEQT